MLNFIMNWIFIPIFASIGACIGTICAEAIVMLYQTYSVRKELKVKKYFKLIFPYFIKALIMFVCVYLINFLDVSGIWKLILQVLVGVSIYSVLNMNYIIDKMNLKNILKLNK